jgi:antitoxin YefM
MKAITTTQAKDNLDELINAVISDLEPTIVSNNHGQQAVLISLDEFNSWQETLYLLSNPANAEHLMASIKQAEAGQVIEQKLPDLLEL